MPEYPGLSVRQIEFVVQISLDNVSIQLLPRDAQRFAKEILAEADKAIEEGKFIQRVAGGGRGARRAVEKRQRRDRGG